MNEGSVGLDRLLGRCEAIVQMGTPASKSSCLPSAVLLSSLMAETVMERTSAADTHRCIADHNCTTCWCPQNQHRCPTPHYQHVKALCLHSGRQSAVYRMQSLGSYSICNLST